MISTRTHSCGLFGNREDFAGLMELYEDNYIRLRQLIPDLQAVGPMTVSRVPGALDLHLRIVERCKYTTTLNLTYFFQDRLGWFPAPDLRIRIYHDAQTAEVLGCGRRRGVREAEYDGVGIRHDLVQKWRVNRFLQKWLGYGLRQGHRFRPGSDEGHPASGNSSEALVASR